MSRHRLLMLVIVLLVVSNIATAALLFRSGRTLRLWEEEMRSPVGYAAVLRASREFHAEKRKLYELVEMPADGGVQEQFTGRVDGPFEVWQMAWFPEFSPPNRMITEAFVDTYNMRMKAMQANPQRYEDSANEPETTPPKPEARSSSVDTRKVIDSQ